VAFCGCGIHHGLGIENVRADLDFPGYWRIGSYKTNPRNSCIAGIPSPRRDVHLVRLPHKQQPLSASGQRLRRPALSGSMKLRQPLFLAKGRCMDNIFVERLWRSPKYEEVYLHAYASVAEARTGISAWLHFYKKRSASIRASVIARRGKFTRRACGYVDDRRCRPAALPPLSEPARTAGKYSPSPTYPQAPQPAKELILKR
jgi:hypothetical protein